MILHKGKVGQIYNIGTSGEVSVLQVAKDLISFFGLHDRENEFLHPVENRLFNDFRYSMSSDKLHKLGWEQEVSWKDGLIQTGIKIVPLFVSHMIKVNWYRKNVVSDGNPWWEGYESALVPHPRRGTE